MSRRWLFALACAASGCAVASAPLSAAAPPEYPTGDFEILIPNPVLRPGEQPCVEGEGFGADSPILGYLGVPTEGTEDVEQVEVFSTTADETGAFDVCFDLPLGLRPGTYPLTIMGLDQEGQWVQQVVELTVVEDEPTTTVPSTDPPTTRPGGQIPSTGSEASPVVRVGAVLLVLGCGVVVLSRRQPRRV